MNLTLSTTANSHSSARQWTGVKARYLSLVAVMLLAARAGAGPFQDLKVPFTQPDGTVVEVIGSGDEFYAVFETAAGYTAVFDAGLQAYCFAVLGADGRLVSSGAPLHKADPASLGIAPHLRMSAAARKLQVVERWRRWEAAMQVETSWAELKAASRIRAGTGPGTGVEPSPPPFTTTGVKVGLCLLIDFDDDPATIPQAEIINFCNGDNYSGYSNNGSVKKYFQDNANGGLTYSNVVTVYVRIPNSLHPKSYYNNTANDCGDQANLLIRDALNLLKALPNYATEILPTFNNLTVDANNRVVACNVFYAGGNGGVWSYGLWPHSWSLYNVGAQELSAGGKKVYKYQITNIGNSLTLGTFCHENGHMLCGFPDIYDYDYDSSGGAGIFCLMNSGGSGANPVQICAYLKRAAGWATTTELTSSSALAAVVSAGPGTNFNHFYRYQKPGVATEYFLVECRDRSGRDARLPTSGIAIWHIDELGDHDNQSLIPNASHANYEVTLVQADNRWDFQRHTNSGDAMDLYYSGNPAPGYANAFSDLSAPAASWWDGSVSGASFHDFSARGPNMSFLVGYVSMAPQIVTQPQDLTVLAGWNATFSVAAIGTAPLAYQWYFNGAEVSGGTDSSHSVSGAQTNAAGPYQVILSNPMGSATSQVATLTVLPAITLAQALDTSNWVWTTGGTTGWVAQIDVTHDSVDAARSGIITNSQNSWLQTTLTNGPGTVEWWWKVSSESGYDFLEFYLDGVLQTGRISGEVDWQQRTLWIGGGSRVLRWRYVKDSVISAGQDRGWLDQVSFTPDPASAPVILTQPQNQTVVVGGNATFSVTSGGSWPLTYQWWFNGTNIGGATASSYTRANAQLTHAGGYQVLVTNALGWATSTVATLTVLQGLTLAEALDAPYLAWSTGGNAGWTAQTATNHDGTDAAQSATITHSQESWVQTTVTNGPGALSFWWRVSSESGYDYLEFYLDGVLQSGRIAGEVAWQLRTFSLAAGTHTLRWRYFKDISVSNGADRGWVDQVSFAPSVIPPATLVARRIATNGLMQLDVLGTAGGSYAIQASTDLSAWFPLVTNVAPFTFTDTNSGSLPFRAYRARSGP